MIDDDQYMADTLLWNFVREEADNGNVGWLGEGEFSHHGKPLFLSLHAQVKTCNTHHILECHMYIHLHHHLT